MIPSPEEFESILLFEQYQKLLGELKALILDRLATPVDMSCRPHQLTCKLCDYMEPKSLCSQKEGEGFIFLDVQQREMRSHDKTLTLILYDFICPRCGTWNEQVKKDLA